MISKMEDAKDILQDMLNNNEEGKLEDRMIIGNDCYKQCYSYECEEKGFYIIDPIDLCYWRERYQNMTHKNKVLSPCAGCTGYNTDCKEYTIK